MYIPGTNNGTWGAGMTRGAMFPSSMGGPLGRPGFPLPNIIEHPAPTQDRPYYSFGKGPTIYQLTPGGVTTEAGWGFKQKAFGRRRSRRSRRSRHSRRCQGTTKNGKQCKHKTTGKYCKHHQKQKRRSHKR